MKETVVQGSFTPRRWWQTSQFLIGASLVVILAVGGGLLAWHHHNEQLAKERAAQQKPAPVVTQAQIDYAHQTVAMEGTVQSFDGTTITFLANDATQSVKLTVSAATTYTQGDGYAPAKVNGLKAGSHAVVSYNKTTNKVAAVAYDL